MYLVQKANTKPRFHFLLLLIIELRSYGTGYTMSLYSRSCRKALAMSWTANALSTTASDERGALF